MAHSNFQVPLLRFQFLRFCWHILTFKFLLARSNFQVSASQIPLFTFFLVKHQFLYFYLISKLRNSNLHFESFKYI